MSEEDRIYPYSFTKEAYEEYRREAPPLQDFSKQHQVDINIIDPSQEWHGELPPLEWTVHDLIPKRQVCLFSGHGAAGKSTIALHLAAAHALGLPFLNFSPEPGNTLFFDAEDEVLVMRHRLKAILDNYDAKLSDLQGRLSIISRTGQDAVLANAIRGIITPTPLFEWLLQEMSRLQPRQTVIASSANVFAGNELDRTQVTQFISLLTRLAIAADGSVILISHPSLTGMNSGSGISGNTAWHNAVRAQMYLEGIKNEGEEEATGLRKLTFKKNQYGPVAGSITLKWQNGMFLPEAGISDYQRAAFETKAEDTFLLILNRFTCSNRHVSHKPKSVNYAPIAFAGEHEAKSAGLHKKELETAMQRLFQKLKIKIEPYGPKSDKTDHLVIM